REPDKRGPRRGLRDARLRRVSHGVARIPPVEGHHQGRRSETVSRAALPGVGPEFSAQLDASGRYAGRRYAATSGSRRLHESGDGQEDQLVRAADRSVRSGHGEYPESTRTPVDGASHSGRVYSECPAATHQVNRTARRGLLFALPALWAAAALYIDVRAAWLRLPLILAYLLATGWILARIPRPPQAAGLCLAAFGGALLWSSAVTRSP